MQVLDFLTDFFSNLLENVSDGSTHPIFEGGMTHLPFEALTDHQRSLCNAIDACGVPLDTSDRCLQLVMDTIGADPSDAAFVRQRIALNIETYDFLDYVDSQLRQAEKLVKF